MSTRRNFIAKTVAGMAGLSLLPAVNAFANPNNDYKTEQPGKFKLRFALASDLHYAQEGTDYHLHTENMVKWLNADHQKNHLDFAIINGDLVHNRPDLLPEVKNNYLEKLHFPYHTLPGNHDFADAAIWKSVFGYADNYTFDHGDVAFVLANTADKKGSYICPDGDFLKKALDGYARKKTVFVVLHVAPVIWLKEEVGTFIDCPDIVKLLHSYPNVKAVFHGHDHNLDGMRKTGNLPHFFDSHIGGSWGTDYRGYRIVEIDNNDAIFTYQVNASQNPVLNANKI